MAIRRGPKNGYDVGQKRQYRRNIWAIFRDAFAPDCASAHALLMPSLEGDEIDVALAAGFKEHNLHIVDDNPAIVAVLKRRYPHINTYGVDVVRAIERIAKNGVKLSAANFDFTNPISSKYMDRLEILMSIGAWAPCRTIALTTLKGRETGGMFAAIKEFELNPPMELHEGDARIRALYSFMVRNDLIKKDCQDCVGLAGYGQYRSSRVPMIWAVAYIGSGEFLVRQSDFRRRLKEFIMWAPFSSRLLRELEQCKTNAENGIDKYESVNRMKEILDMMDILIPLAKQREAYIPPTREEP